jgi:transposase, IS5 family
LTLRQFTDSYCDPMPKHERGFNRLTPATLKPVNDLVAAVGLGLEDGAPRVDRRWSC